jgi:hypothetical protein
MRFMWTIAVVIVLAPLVALAANAEDCGSPTDLHDGWTVAAPEQEGLDAVKLCVRWTPIVGQPEPSPNSPLTKSGFIDSV